MRTMYNCYPIKLKKDHLIMPENIKSSPALCDTFGKTETERSATWLIDFAQKRGQGWTPFTLKDITDFYNKWFIGEPFYFNGLISNDDHGWIILADDNIYHFTVGFVIKCYASSPRLD